MVIDFNPFFILPSNIERMLSQTLAEGTRGASRTGYPPLNISSDDSNIYVRCELPGLEINEVEITLADASLSIKGERNPVQGKYYRQERPVGPFQRVVNINTPVDRDAVKATLKDGLLIVTLPKSTESKPYAITIE